MKAGHSNETKRFFVDFPEDLPALPFTLEVRAEATVHHLRTVVRAQAGEAVVAVDGVQRRAYAATIKDISRNRVWLVVQEAITEAPPETAPIRLAAALIKEQRWDWLIQKATELGVSAIQPLTTERTIVKVHDPAKKRERWQTVVRGAAEQSEGLFVPPVLEPVSLDALCAGAPEGLKILLLERGENRPPLREVLRSNMKQPVTLAIGPEGGWSDTEVAQLLAAGFQPASLGGRILRSETAAIAALSAILYERSE